MSSTSRMRVRGSNRRVCASALVRAVSERSFGARVFDARERLEQEAAVRLGDDRSAVAYHQTQPGLTAFLYSLGCHPNLAAGGELHGVGQQVYQDLPQAARIHIELVRNAGA